jgi:hypothetical protein
MAATAPEGLEESCARHGGQRRAREVGASGPQTKLHTQRPCAEGLQVLCVSSYSAKALSCNACNTGPCRTRASPTCAAEFKQVLVLAVEEEKDKNAARQWRRGLDRQAVIAGVTLPKHAKLIRIRLPEGGLRGSDAGADEDKDTFDERNVEGLARFIVEIGVPWSPGRRRRSIQWTDSHGWTTTP